MMKKIQYIGAVAGTLAMALVSCSAFVGSLTLKCHNPGTEDGKCSAEQAKSFHYKIGYASYPSGAVTTVSCQASGDLNKAVAIPSDGIACLTDGKTEMQINMGHSAGFCGSEGDPKDGVAVISNIRSPCTWAASDEQYSTFNICTKKQVETSKEINCNVCATTDADITITCPRLG